MAGVLSSIIISLLSMGFNMLATGCQSLLASYLNLSIPITWIDIALLVIGIVIIIHSPILLLASIGLVVLYVAGY